MVTVQPNRQTIMTTAQIRHKLRKLLCERAGKLREGFTEEQLRSLTEQIQGLQNKLRPVQL